MSFFDELKASLEEAVEIRNGAKAPSRVTRYEPENVSAVRENLNITRSEMSKVPETSADPSGAGKPDADILAVVRERLKNPSKRIRVSLDEL